MSKEAAFKEAKDTRLHKFLYLVQSLVLCVFLFIVLISVLGGTAVSMARPCEGDLRTGYAGCENDNLPLVVISILLSLVAPTVAAIWWYRFNNYSNRARRQSSEQMSNRAKNTISNASRVKALLGQNKHPQSSELIIKKLSISEAQLNEALASLELQGQIDITKEGVSAR